MPRQNSAELGDWLSQQEAIATVAQLRVAGVASSTTWGRVRRGQWQRMHPGVICTYSGPITWRAQVWAAILACGPGSVASHDTAAALWGLPAPMHSCHITVPAPRTPVVRQGIVVHRSRLLLRTMHPGATPPRTRIEHTVLDRCSAADTLDTAYTIMGEAVGARRTTVARLHEAALSRPTLPRRGVLLTMLSDVDVGAHTILERGFARDVERAHGLPTGRRQAHARLGPANVFRDVRYDDYCLCVELDGRRGHSDPRDVLRDLRRDNATTVIGDATLRYGYIDVVGHPCKVASQVAAVLQARGWTGAPRRCSSTCTVITRPA